MTWVYLAWPSGSDRVRVTQPLSGPELYAEIVAYLEAAGWERDERFYWQWRRPDGEWVYAMHALNAQLAVDGVGHGAHAGQETRP